MITKGKRKKCPECGTFRTNKMGVFQSTKRRLQRYRCLECGKSFTREE